MTATVSITTNNFEMSNLKEWTCIPEPKKKKKNGAALLSILLYQIFFSEKPSQSVRI